jgi:hypothetical protein
MEGILLTLADLRLYCNLVYNDTATKNDYFSPFFELIKVSGCRFIEAVELTRWSKIGISKYLLNCAKGNNTRVVSLEGVSNRLNYIIENKQDYYNRLNFNSAKNYFRSLTHFEDMFCKNKSILFHVFRHLRFKELDNEGKSLEDICKIMGEKYEKTSNGYVTSKIYLI